MVTPNMFQSRLKQQLCVGDAGCEDNGFEPGTGPMTAWTGCCAICASGLGSVNCRNTQNKQRIIHPFGTNDKDWGLAELIENGAEEWTVLEKKVRLSSSAQLNTGTQI